MEYQVSAKHESGTPRQIFIVEAESEEKAIEAYYDLGGQFLVDSVSLVRKEQS